eukprot:13628248-Alexandrium_andersonii.AAC.1
MAAKQLDRARQQDAEAAKAFRAKFKARLSDGKRGCQWRLGLCGPRGLLVCPTCRTRAESSVLRQTRSTRS